MKAANIMLTTVGRKQAMKMVDTTSSIFPTRVSLGDRWEELDSRETDAAVFLQMACCRSLTKKQMVKMTTMANERMPDTTWLKTSSIKKTN